MPVDLLNNIGVIHFERGDLEVSKCGSFCGHFFYIFFKLENYV